MVASSSTSAPSITIFGATGAQGGSVLTHLLASDKEYRIKAVTRDPSKPNAKAIAEKGVEVIKAELGNKADVEAAVRGQDMVFAVTNYWEHGAAKEVEDGKRLSDAIKAAGVKLFLWSGLEPVSKVSKGKYTKVEHFDTKAEILEYAKSQDVPVIDVQPACYMENFLSMMGPKKQDDGSFVFAYPIKPTSKLSLLNCKRDYGAFVRGAIESGLKGGDEVLACGDELTLEEMTRKWGEITGKKVSYYHMDGETFEKQAGEEFTEMLLWFSDFGYYGPKDVSPSRKVLKERVQSWEEFVKASDWSKVFA